MQFGWIVIQLAEYEPRTLKPKHLERSYAFDAESDSRIECHGP
jgi:hypothetical protein